MTEAYFRTYEKGREMINKTSGKVSERQPVPDVQPLATVTELYHGPEEDSPVILTHREGSYPILPGEAPTFALTDNIVLEVSHKAYEIIDLTQG